MINMVSFLDRIHEYINFFDECEELEFTGFQLNEPDDITIFGLTKLKVLAIKYCVINVLVINCPLLETFICWSVSIQEANFENAERLKYFECINTISSFKSTSEFVNLECLNLFNGQNKLKLIF